MCALPEKVDFHPSVWNSHQGCSTPKEQHCFVGKIHFFRFVSIPYFRQRSKIRVRFHFIFAVSLPDLSIQFYWARNAS